MIAEADMGRFSEAALILAARLAQEPWLSAQTADMVDADLRRI